MFGLIQSIITDESEDADALREQAAEARSDAQRAQREARQKRREAEDLDDTLIRLDVLEGDGALTKKEAKKRRAETEEALAEAEAAADEAERDARRHQEAARMYAERATAAATEASAEERKAAAENVLGAAADFEEALTAVGDAALALMAAERGARGAGISPPTRITDGGRREPIPRGLIYRHAKYRADSDAKDAEGDVNGAGLERRAVGRRWREDQKGYLAYYERAITESEKHLRESTNEG